MIFIDMLAWWYGPAWRDVWRSVGQRTGSVLDAFSVGLLARTLFSPFRQIDAGGVRGPLGAQLRAWFDRTFSRFIGLGVRSVMIISGSVLAAITLVAGVLFAVLWLLVPVLPVIGIVLTLSGRTL